MNISIDAATASIITAILVGAISLITTLIANQHSFRQQQAQWIREEKRAQREEIQAEKALEAAHKKELSTHLQEIYGNSIASLTALLIYNDRDMRLRPDYQANLKEAQKWLSLIVAFHYDKGSKEYVSLLDLYTNTLNSYERRENIPILRSKIIEFASQDPRLQF